MLKLKPSIILLLALMLLVGLQAAYAQGLSGTLTGIVSDQSKALIPGATVVLTDTATGAARRTVTNAEGFFSISAIPAGTYNVAVEAQGFRKFEQTGVVFHPGDKIALSNITLEVGTVEQEVKVYATPDVVVPVDTGEKAHVITSRQIQNLAVLGRSADELLKILPGVVYNGADDPGTPAGFVVQFNKGIGNYNVAGTRNTQIANRSDGADVIDPGCNCGSAVTPNVDMMQEIKVQTANFAAENQQGPVVFNAVSKSGTSDFHGEGYLYVRRPEFNSQDWRNNFFKSPKPLDSFYFPGFNIGGPLSKSRKKLFFFAGVEWMRQNHDLGVHQATVPTAAMRNGDFTDTAYIRALNGSDVNLTPMNDQELGDSGNGWYNSGNPLTAAMLSGGKINPAAMDPSGKAMLNMYPLPNTDPRKAGGYNYTSSILNPEHRNQQLVRIDYNISDNTKLYTRFNHEYQASPSPYTLWWYNSNDVPYPGGVRGDYTTWSSSTSLVNVLDPTTTNELVVGLTDWRMPHKMVAQDKVSRKALGYKYRGVFGNTTDVIPNMTDWGSGIADFIQPGGLVDPKIFGYKWLVNVSDNFSKVKGTHTLKFGAYFAFVTNDEPTTGTDQGELSPTNWGGNSTSNAWADLLLGRVGNYDETSINNIGNYRKREWSGYAQDSWKVTRRLTIEYGARFQHPGWMYEQNGHMFGFDTKLYDPKKPYSGLVATNVKGIADTLSTGEKVSNSVWLTPKLMVAPRFGFAWDISGKGDTVIRGGGGVYYYNDRNGDVFGAIGNPPLQYSANICCGLELKEIDNLDPLKHLVVPNLTVLVPGETKMPTTYSWSFTLSKRLRTQTVVEASYVGNASFHQMNCTNCSARGSINAVPERAMFGHETEAPNNFRPYRQYGNINLRGHGQSQNYNSLQITANRQTGRVNFQLAYAFAKTLGIGGDSFGRATDLFDARRRSYGPLPYDRTHTFSIAYSIMLPGNFRQPMAAGLLNGWQISGITQAQSGAPLSDFEITGALSDINPATGEHIQYSAQWVNGTSDTAARPYLICDPRSNLASGQYANPACFAAPHVGANGTYAMPYMKGPKFQNHDVSLFKNFSFSERKKLQFRWSMYNFLNHPNGYFAGNDPGTKLVFVNGKPDQNSLDHFGRTSFKRGRRLMQFALKFSF